MKIKHKIGFIAAVSLVDIMVIILVVMSNSKTNIKNDISSKASANFSNELAKIEDNLIIDKEENEVELPTEQEENTENEVELPTEQEEIQIEEEQVVDDVISVSYDEMSIEEKENALYNGTLALEYSGLYTYTDNKLTKQRGVYDYNGHHETYYDEKSLPGTGLNIPGRHVADDGTIRDEEGYICVAANQEYMAKGSILITSLGPAKVYDTGCAYGTIDIYVNW